MHGHPSGRDLIDRDDIVVAELLYRPDIIQDVEAKAGGNRPNEEYP